MSLLTRGIAPMPALLNQREASELLRLSTRTLERMRLTGLGPKYHKCGRRVLYSADHIEAWLAARTVSSTSEATAQ
jgi:predicted DNA-binding transcriptional regulator AlpA